MAQPIGPRVIVIATFLSLSVGFVAGYLIASGSDGSTTLSAGSPPHAVGPDQYLQLGTRALETGDFPAAERYFRGAAEMAPDQAGPHADLAVALMYQERWEEARMELEVAERLAPETPEIWFLQGIVYRDGIGDPARARESWEKFLAMVPPDAPQAETVQTWLEGLGTSAGGTAR